MNIFSTFFAQEVIILRKRICDMEIQESKLKEQHEKEDRELRHMIGLERKRHEFELQQATGNIALELGQQNLVEDKKRFEDQMVFHQKRFETEVVYLKDMMKDILERLPNFSLEVKRK